SVGQLVEEPLIVQGLLSKKERMKQVTEIITKVGLRKGDLQKYPHEFSGGQRQRISIARALVVNPKFVICDEPVSALDVSIQAQVLNLMKDLQEELGLTYLFIAHDLSV
ncbi:ATP-binding cassette domain-containing protein, partial [Microvirga sp. 3-52]|nr:ATP-binding cassette domain-containing protein [Microvirga sp. 3-52]